MLTTNKVLNYFQTNDLSHKFKSTKEYHDFIKYTYELEMDDIESHFGKKKDPLALSIREQERVRFDEDGESWVYYGILVFDPEDIEMSSEGEIDEWFEEFMAVRIYSDYDCTGKPFTRFIDWHNNGNGLVSYQHYMALDV